MPVIRSVSLRRVPVRMKMPLLSATVDLPDCLIVMVAPATGVPSSLITEPLMVIDWQLVSMGYSNARQRMSCFIFAVDLGLKPEAANG